MEKSYLSKKISEYAASEPSRLAITSSDGRRASFLDVMNVYEQIRKFLEESAIKSYERIGILSQDGFATSLLMLSVMENAVAVPVNGDLSSRQLRQFLELTRVSYVLTDMDDPTISSQTRLIEAGVIRFQISALKGTIHCRFNLERESRIMDLPQGVPHDRLAMIRTTSGTTSKPKVVPILYETRIRNLLKHEKYYPPYPGYYPLVLSNMSRINAFNVVLRALYFGNAVFVTAGQDFNELLKLIQSEPITEFSASPVYHASFIDYISKQQLVIKPMALRYIRSSGAFMSKKMIRMMEDLYGVEVLQNYGMTETGIIASTAYSKKNKMNYFGIAAGMELKIENGEILVKGDTVFPGYETDEGLDRNQFTKDWFHTGDLGYIDEDGYVFITGRIKEMINRGGEKVSPYEVEEALLSHPKVREAAVFPYPGGEGVENVGAVIVPEGSHDVSLEALRRHLTGKIPTFKMPTRLYSLAQIPVSDNGKVQRKGLFDTLDAAGYSCEEHDVNSESVDELLVSGWHDREKTIPERLNRLWCFLLKKKIVDPHRNFFHLGGDSLGVATLLSMVADEFGVQVPVMAFYQNPTIEHLTHLISTDQGNQQVYQFAVPLKLEGQGAPLFCVDIDDSESVGYRPIATHIKDRPVYGLRLHPESASWEEPITYAQIAEKHIEEMKTIHPEGPYHLIGLCADGRLAGEIGRRLRAEGKSVGVLAMLDPVMPGDSGKRKKKDYSMRRVLSDIAIKVNRAFRHLPEQSLSEWPEYLKRKAAALPRYVRTFRLLRDNHGAAGPPKVPEKATPRFIRHLAGKTHQDQYYPGKILFFQPEQKTGKSVAAVAAWEQLAESLEIIPLKGRHDDMIVLKENQERIAEKLNEEMKQSN